MNEDDRRKALELMLEYLKDRYADQMTSLQKVDSKINIRLTVFMGLLGLVTLGLQALASRAIPPALLSGTAVLVVAFGVCLFRTLWLTLLVLDVKIDIPGIEPEPYEKAARHEKLTLLPVLQSFVVNYVQTVASNWELIDERDKPGESLKRWSRRTMVAAFVTVGFVGLVYVGTALSPVVGKEEAVMTEEEKPQASSEGTPATSSGGGQETDAVPSLEAKPQRVELGKTAKNDEGVQTFRGNQTSQKEEK